MTIVTGTDMRSRPAGFAQCLREVMIKLSGEPRLAGDPRMARLAARAGDLVTAYRYVDPRAAIRPHDDQGSYDRSYDLTVIFDRARVDAALGELGLQPWSGPRPVVVPVLAVRGLAVPYTHSYLLTAEEPQAAVQRASFANSGQTYGLPVRIPGAAEFAAWNVSLDRTAELPAGAAGEVLVGGTLEFREGIGWVGAWRMHFLGREYDWSVAGVGFDQAFDDLLRGVLRVAAGHRTPQ